MKTRTWFLSCAWVSVLGSLLTASCEQREPTCTTGLTDGYAVTFKLDEGKGFVGTCSPDQQKALRERVFEVVGAGSYYPSPDGTPDITKAPFIALQGDYLGTRLANGKEPRSHEYCNNVLKPEAGDPASDHKAYASGKFDSDSA